MFAATNQIKMQASATVALWTTDATSTAWIAARMNILTAAERAEFAKISQPAARWQSMSARIVLRVALSDAVDGAVAPEAWEFVKGANGKKAVAAGLPVVHFSVSHNETMAVVAVSTAHEVGVDVEAFGAEVNEDVVAEFFAASEQATIASANDASGEFVRFWTLKEAFTKLTGEGFNRDFTTVEFAANDDRLIAANDNATFKRFEVANCQIALAIAA